LKRIKESGNELRQFKIINKKKYSINTEILLFTKRKVAFIAHKEEIALVVESKDIFETIENIFNLLWDILPEKPKNY
jgi:hypothetical protein